jgi:hypothetical protein
VRFQEILRRLAMSGEGFAEDQAGIGLDPAGPSAIIIPFAFLELRPEGTTALLRRSQDWLLGHAFQLMAGIALALGAYLTVSGLVRLS